MKSIRFLRYWACVVGVLATAICALGGKKPPPPPPAPIIATTTDRNFLEVDVDKVACQTEFDLAIEVSGTGTHYRYKVGPAATTNPGVLTGYSAPILKTTPVSFNLTGHGDDDYVLCLQGLEVDRKGRIENSQPLSEATAYYWQKDTPPVEYQVTFTGALEGSTLTWIYAIDNFGTAVGNSGNFQGVRWTLETGLEDISSLDASWFDLESNEFVDGWILSGARDINGAGQIAGSARDVITWDKRACVYDPLAGFLLLPRLTESPYDEAEYSGLQINENGEVQGQINVPASGDPNKVFLWTPISPGIVHVIEAGDLANPNANPNGIASDVFSVYVWGQTCRIELYEFQFNSEGVLFYSLLETVADPAYPITNINEDGAFGYGTDNGTTQSIKLYLPDQGSLTVRESTNALFEYPHDGFRTNNSNDFVYNLDSIPYLYRHTENRSYRLYDLADSYTKTVLFASSNGTLKNSTNGIYGAVVSDDNTAGAPTANPFDAISGWVSLDLTAEGNAGFVLTPFAKQ